MIPRLTRILLTLFVVCSPSVVQAQNADKLPPNLWKRTAGVDWPSFLGPDRNSTSPEKNLTLPLASKPPHLKYTIPLGEGYGMPSVYRGRLYMFDRVGDHMRLVSYHAETAEKLWEFKYPTDFEDMLNYSNGPRAQPVVHEDKVYVFGSEGMLHCLNNSDGRVIWKVNTTKQFGVVKNFFGAGSTPLIEDDLLIVHIGGSPPSEHENIYDAAGKIESNGTGIVAFNKNTGEVVYKSLKALASYSSPIIHTLHGKRVGFIFAREGLFAFNPKDGKEYFHFPWRAEKLESVNAATPIVFGNHVFISETYGPGSALLSVNNDMSHKVVWKDKGFGRRSLQAHWNTPIEIDGYIYACSGRNSGGADVRCIKADTGEVKWSQKVNARSSLLYVQGHLIAQAEFGPVFIFKPDPEQFTLISRFGPVSAEGKELIQYPAWGAPILSHGYLWLRGARRLVCYDLKPAAE